VSVSIVGLGEWLPDEERGNDALGDRGPRSGGSPGERTFNDIPRADGALGDIVARHLAAEADDPFLGVVTRRVASETDSARAAEAAAARAALADAGIDGSEVDVVLSYSITTDHVVATAPYVAESIGAKRSLAFAIDAACAAPLAQLELALALVSSGRARTVVATQSHLLLRAMPSSHPATPGLGDGATAYVVSARDHGARFVVRDVVSVTDGSYYDAVLWVRDRAEERETPWWDEGSSFRLGSRWPEGTKALMRDTVACGEASVRALADKVGLDVSRIDVLASVQPRGFIPPAIARALGLSDDVAVTTYERRGHMGGTGPISNLLEARRRGRIVDASECVLYAQGAGFTRSAAWLSYVHPEA